MKISCVLVRLCAVAAIGLFLTGCLTSGVIYSVNHPPEHSRRITGVTGATLVGDRVFIRVDVALERGKSETLTVEIPVDDLERDGRSTDWSPTTGPGEITFRVPESAVRRSGSLPRKGTPLPIEPLDLQRSEVLADFSERLGPGVHVVSIRVMGDITALGMRIIPAVLDTRDGRQPTAVVLADLPPSVKHRGSLLLLLPVTVAADVVTLPLQIVLALLVGC